MAHLDLSFLDELLITQLVGAGGVDMWHQYTEAGGTLSVWDWIRGGQPTEPTPEELTRPEEQEADLERRLREAIDELEATGELSYEGNEDLQDRLTELGYELITSDVVGELAEDEWVYKVAVVEPEEVTVVQRFHTSDRELFGAELSDGTYVDWDDNPTTLEEIEAAMAEHEAGLVGVEGLEWIAPDLYLNPDGTYVRGSGAAVDDATAQIEIENYQTGITPEVEPAIDPEREAALASQGIFIDAEGNFVSITGEIIALATDDPQMQAAKIEAYLWIQEQEEKSTAGQLTPAQQSQLDLEREMFEWQQEQAELDREETPFERAQREAWEAEQFAGPEDWITKWFMEQGLAEGGLEEQILATQQSQQAAIAGLELAAGDLPPITNAAELADNLANSIEQIEGWIAGILGVVQTRDMTSQDEINAYNLLTSEEQAELDSFYELLDRNYQQMHALSAQAALTANLANWPTGGEFEQALLAAEGGDIGTPPAPAWLPEFVPGLQPGQAISPAQAKLASGQTLQRMTPSEMAGLGGFIDWSAGKVAGAPASYQDWLQESMALLPTRVPRGTVRWAPSPFRA